MYNVFKGVKIPRKLRKCSIEVFFYQTFLLEANDVLNMRHISLEKLIQPSNIPHLDQYCMVSYNLKPYKGYLLTIKGIS